MTASEKIELMFSYLYISGFVLYWLSVIFIKELREKFLYGSRSNAFFQVAVSTIPIFNLSFAIATVFTIEEVCKCFQKPLKKRPNVKNGRNR